MYSILDQLAATKRWSEAIFLFLPKTMFRFKATLFLFLFVFFSFVVESESYIGIVDSDTYSTVDNFANECVKWRDLRAPLNHRRWKKLKEFRKKVHVKPCFLRFKLGL